VSTPHRPAARERARGRPRPVTVPLSGFGLSAPVVTSPGRLLGWSLLAVTGAGNGIEASLQGVAAATATLTLTGFALVSSVTVTPAAAWPAGANVVTVNNVTGGPIIAQIEGGTENPVVITFNPMTGVSGTANVVVPAIVGGPAYTIDASGSPSAGGQAGNTAIANLMDGGQVVGVMSALAGLANTEVLDPEGIYVGTSLAINVISGSVIGVIWWLDDWHGGDN